MEISELETEYAGLELAKWHPWVRRAIGQQPGEAA